MATRSGLQSLINEFGVLVSDYCNCVINAEVVQSLLDKYRTDFYGSALTPVTQTIGGSVVYKVYTSEYKNMESGTAVFRLYDSNGESITDGYTVDYARGVVTFTDNQGGSARYIDGRTYDIYNAVADGWRIRAATGASGYDFKVDGRSYSKSQYFEHCAKMAEYYSSMATPTRLTIERGDTL